MAEGMTAMASSWKTSFLPRRASISSRPLAISWLEENSSRSCHERAHDVHVWDDFFKGNPSATRQEILDQMARMRRDFGI